jgi:hypothetical protein
MRVWYAGLRRAAAVGVAETAQVVFLGNLFHFLDTSPQTA